MQYVLAWTHGFLGTHDEYSTFIYQVHYWSLRGLQTCQESLCNMELVLLNGAFGNLYSVFKRSLPFTRTFYAVHYTTHKPPPPPSQVHICLVKKLLHTVRWVEYSTRDSWAKKQSEKYVTNSTKWDWDTFG